MPVEELEKTSAAERHEDPITHEPGSHPVSTGVGAAGAGVIGAVIGTVVAGPVGGVVGATVGALAGGFGGSTVGEVMDPTVGSKPVVAKDQIPDPINEFAMASAIGAGLNPFGATGDGMGTLPPFGLTPPVTDTIPSDYISPDYSDIALRAWCIYEEEGYPDGRALNHWLQAEKELS